jgi:hydroxymethylpyrimidine pyrophosphatase-like HAD family hydrolase
MRAIALVDLDDTLFQTRRKCPAELTEGTLTPVAFARDGEPLGFATPRQLAFLTWLSETTRLVPVTGRSLDALRRVKLDFTAGVCAHGGVVLREDGSHDPDWAAHIAAEAARHAEMLDRLAAAVRVAADAAGTPLSIRVLDEDGVPLYVIVKHPDAIDHELNAVVDAMVGEVPGDWTVHRNGNNIALMPPFLGKAHAVAPLLADLRAQFPAAPVIGIGDSLTDAPFMKLCDFAMMPTGSQLAAVVLP